LLASGEDAPFDLLVTHYSLDGSGEEACCDVYEEIGEHHPQIGAERADVEADMVDFIKALSEFGRTRHTGLGIIN
jgi:hypothetical protein